MTRYKVDKQEPLRIELRQFVSAVAGHRGELPPLTMAAHHGTQGHIVPSGPATIVTAEDGVEALRLALLIVESGQTGKVIDAARKDEGIA